VPLGVRFQQMLCLLGVIKERFGWTSRDRKSRGRGLLYGQWLQFWVLGKKKFYQIAGHAAL
jgi:hypothetical protein